MKAVSFLSLLPADISCNNNTPTSEISLTTGGSYNQGSYNQWSSSKGLFQLGVLQPGALQ